MAPVQSRSACGSHLGLVAMTAGGLWGTQLFLNPAAPRGAPAAAPRGNDVADYRAKVATTSAVGSGAPLVVPGVMGAAMALLLARGSAGRRKGLGAVATADVEAPPPPPAFDPAKEVGAIAPMGFFDPLGFTKVGDEAGFRKLRTAEIKHGRVAMMASIGAVVQHFIRFPGFEKAHGTFGVILTGEGVLGFVPLFAACGVLELAWQEKTNREPGNFGNPLGVEMYNEEMRNKELSNGRMAMISVLGIMAAELATGKDAIEQFGL